MEFPSSCAQLINCDVIMLDEPSGHRITSGGLRTGSSPSHIVGNDDKVSIEF